MLEVTGQEVNRVLFIKRRWQQKLRRVVRRSGLHARDTIRSLIKPSPIISPPGGPPHTHVRPGLRETTHAAFDPVRISTVAGPTLIPRQFQARTYPSGAIVLLSHRKSLPNLLNTGGLAILTVYYASGRVKRTRIRYRPRPFVGAAFVSTIIRLRQLLIQERL